MRISFDLDDTLILKKEQFQKDKKRKLINGEYLRVGAIELLRNLNKEHEIIIYTTSYRSPLITKLAFWLKNIKITQVINNSLHLKKISNYNFGVIPSKYPPQFDIDIHVDDSLGVFEEGKKFGFKVIHVNPEESEWSNNILKIINKL
jgi:hypothetical protein